MPEILAIAATTPHAADEAVKLVKVEYETHPFVLDVESAMKSTSHQVFAATVVEKRSEGDMPGGESKVEQLGNIRGPKVGKKLKSGCL